VRYHYHDHKRKRLKAIESIIEESASKNGEVFADTNKVMTMSIRELEPINLDSTQWRRKVIDITFNTIDGHQLKYQGDALVSESGQTHTIEFEFKTHPLSPASVEIPLSVSFPASIRLRVNDQVASTSELVVSKDQAPVLQSLTANVTKETESRRISRLRLRISYEGQAGATTILLGDDQGERKPNLLQLWSWRYALQSLAFFVLAWGSILGLAILVVVNIRPLGEFRLYAVLTTVVAWGCSVLGIPDLAKIPFRSLLRKLYGRTRLYRAVSLTALALLFVLVGTGTATVIYCFLIRQRYSDLINKAIAMKEGPDRDEVIRRAFVLVPWRKEAQSLFELRAWQLRRDDMIGFRKNIREFVTQTDVKRAVLSAPSYNNLPFYFDKNADSAFSDPVVWYASLLPEADEDKQHAFAEMAVSILSGKDANSDAEAKILRTYLRLSFAQREKNLASERERVGELLNLLNQYDNFKNVAATQTYQMGCDILACYYIVSCQPKDASKWFGKELDARRRQQQTASDLPLWQRPPEKLRLYHMFLLVLSNMEATGENTKIAKDLLQWDTYGECESSYEKEFKETIFNRNPPFQNNEAWLKGTVLEQGKLNTLINTLLNRGWRY